MIVSILLVRCTDSSLDSDSLSGFIANAAYFYFILYTASFVTVISLSNPIVRLVYAVFTLQLTRRWS